VRYYLQVEDEESEGQNKIKMNIKNQIEAGLRGEQSIPCNLICRYAKKEGIESKPIIEKFEALVKSGSHTKMYIGRPADWTYIPRSAAFSGTSSDSPELANLKASFK
jgi:hypothetical protein